MGPRARRVSLVVDLEPEELAVGGDEAAYVRTLANLISYALDAMGRRGELQLRARERGEEVLIHVQAGPGGTLLGAIPGLDGESDGLGAGGLGLSMAFTLITSMGGRLEARRTSGGVLFTLTVPRAPERRARARPVEEAVLVVGREELARSFESLLSREGYEILPVSTGEEALALLDDDAPVAAVATELVLSGMSGLTLAEEVLRRQPRLRGRILLVTDARLASVPSTVVALSPPLRRVELLHALGRRVRRRR